MKKLFIYKKLCRRLINLSLVSLAMVAHGQDFTNNGGTITAQYTNANSAENYPRLIDNDPTTKYYISYAAVWVQYQSTAPVVVAQYTITSANDSPSRDPKDWTLQGSNNGSSWTVLDTQSGQAFATRFLTKSYLIANSTAYTYYRLNITANSGATATQFAELELLGNDGSVDLTNNGGTISAQYTNANTNENFPKVIDNSVTTKYYTNNSTVWIQYQSTVPSVSTRYTITSANDSPTRDPRNWSLQGSNNGTTWTTIDNQSNQTFAARYVTKTYWLTSNTSSYSYYRLNITANNGATATQLSEWEVWGNTPPAAPGSLTAAATSASQINISWSDNSDNETGFEIERSSDGTNFTSLASVAANTASYSNTGLSQLTTYYYRVRAVNTAAPSAYSSVANATTPDVIPAAPTGLTAIAASSSKIDLSWTDNSNNETGFQIERSADGTNFTFIASATPEATGYSDTGLSPVTTYHYRVSAAGTAGNSAYTNVANATTPDVIPAPPTALTAAASSSSQINLGWTDNSGNETGFAIESSTDGSTFTALTSVAANAVTYAHTGLTASTTYYYRVRATGTAGNSAFTSVASATTNAATGGAPAAPTNLAATAASSNRINLTWTDNSANETGFLVEKSIDGVNFTTVTTAAANAVTYGVTGLAASATYYFRVSAVGSAGNSGYTSVVSGATLSSGTITAPNNLTATAISRTEVTLLWNDNATNETGYKIEVSTDNVNYKEVITASANAGAQTINSGFGGIAAGTTYHFRVYAVNGTTASSVYSNTATATTFAATGTSPATPSGLTVTAASSNQINVSWTDNSANETRFRLERSANGSTWVLLTNVTAGVTTYSNQVHASSTFHYRLRAENIYGNSAYTASVSTTTPAGGTQVDVTDQAGLVMSATYAQGTHANAAVEAVDKLIDNDVTTKFLVGQQTNTIVYTCPRTYVVNQYAVTSADAYMERDIKTWTFEGSANGTTWTTLDTRTNYLFATRSESKSFSITNTIPYLYYRFVITRNNGSSDTQIQETELWGTAGPGTLPAAPANFTGAGTSGSVTLTWTDNATNEDGYIIEKSLNGSNYFTLATTGPNATSYVDNSVSSSTTFLYKIRAFTTAGFSSYVGPIYVSTQSPTLHPDITDNTGGIISDQYNTTGIEGYAKLIDNSVYSKYLTAANNVTTWVQYQAPSTAVVTAYAISSGNDAVDRDPVNWTFAGSNDAATWTVLNTQANQRFLNRHQTRTFTFSNTTAFTYYRLTVTLNNGGPRVQFSELQIFGTGGGNPNTAIPALPTGLTANAVSGDQVILTWTDNATNEAGYNLEYSTNGGSTWTAISLPPNTTKYPHFGLPELTGHSYRLRATASQGNSAYTSVVSATTLSSAYPSTWQEHWLEHVQLVTRKYEDQHVAVYFDPDVNQNLTWMFQVMSDAWQYTKNAYGNFSGNKMYAIYHEDKYGGGNPSSFFDAARDYRNAICVGTNDWVSQTGWNLDGPVHEIGHIVEGGSKGVHRSPAFPLWGDSKWMDIYQYDLYTKLGWTSESTRWYNAMQTNVVQFPRANSYWFRDFWYPIYSQHGETAVLNNYFTLLSQYFPKFNGDYTRDMNWGEFFHFWSGAAGVNLKAQATFAFGWNDTYELQFRQAQLDFPFTYDGGSGARNTTQSELAEEKPVLRGEAKITLWPNPANRVLNILLSGGEELKEVGITSLTGATALTKPLAGRLTTIDVSDLRPAVYIIKVISDKGRVFTEKVLINE